MAEEKKNWLGPYIPEGNILREVVQQIKLVYRLMLDPRVHPLAKLIPVGVVAYVLTGGVIPDLIPVLGQMDDAAIIMLGVRLFFEVAPPDVVREHLKRLAHPLTDSEWKVVEHPSEAASAEPPAEPGPDVVEGNFKVTDDGDSKPQ
jgi:uncharacterized membrane protein YkvA (DUF1232 family)